MKVTLVRAHGWKNQLEDKGPKAIIAPPYTGEDGVHHLQMSHNGVEVSVEFEGLMSSVHMDTPDGPLECIFPKPLNVFQAATYLVLKLDAGF